MIFFLCYEIEGLIKWLLLWRFGIWNYLLLGKEIVRIWLWFIGIEDNDLFIVVMVVVLCIFNGSVVDGIFEVIYLLLDEFLVKVEVL